MKRTVVSLGLAALLVGAIALAAHAAGTSTHKSTGAKAPTAKAAKTTYIYVCPMHPTVKSKTPGRCPKCHMSLVKRAVSTKQVAHKPAAKAAFVYVCPMHPTVRQSKPGTCPKCHMALVKQHA
jgi:hypothetical protein